MRQEKKSETLEIRLSYSNKRKFMAQCAQNDATASHVIRNFVGSYISRAHDKSFIDALLNSVGLLRFKRTLTALTLAVGISLSQLSFIASPQGSVDTHTVLAGMDTNRDGFLTATDARDETRAALFTLLERTDKNEDGRLSLHEIDQLPIMRVGQASLSENPLFENPATDLANAKFVSLKLGETITPQALEDILKSQKDLALLDQASLQNLTQQLTRDTAQ
jgi:hypothetical protein